MSAPYPALNAAPKEFTLDVALTPTISKEGAYSCGKLEFESKRDYDNFAAGQRMLGGTPEQLATLHYVESTGKSPHTEAMEAPPKGTTVHQLLDITGKTPDAQGFYNLGTLKVHESEYKAFNELQHSLTARNPEALSALYHMEHTPDKPVTFRVTGDNDRADRYEPGSNTIYWNPHTMIRDAYNGKLVSPDTAALHEETHWAGRDVGATLQQIPAGHWENREEKRVIEGTEARDMGDLHRAPRHSHYGWPLPTDKVNSIVPSLTVEQNGHDREMHAPYQQSGKVIDVDPAGTTTIAIRGDGKQPDHRVTYKTEQLAIAMGGESNAERLLLDAQAHKDTVAFTLTNDGKMLYADPAQAQRLTVQPEAFQYPQAMHATTEPALPAQQRQPAEIGR